MIAGVDDAQVVIDVLLLFVINFWQMMRVVRSPLFPCTIASPCPVLTWGVAAGGTGTGYR